MISLLNILFASANDEYEKILLKLFRFENSKTQNHMQTQTSLKHRRVFLPHSARRMLHNMLGNRFSRLNGTTTTTKMDVKNDRFVAYDSNALVKAAFF